MGSTFSSVLQVLYMSVSRRSSQMTCEYYSQDMPSPLCNHVAGYSVAANSMYIMGGTSDNVVGQTAIFKWDLGADASSEGFSPVGLITDPEWEIKGVQVLFPVDEILYVIGAYGAANTVNRFDTVSNRWLVNGAEPPKEVSAGCVAYNGSHFVMIDGWGDFYETQFVFIQFYDIAHDVWSMHTVDAPFDTTGLDFIRWRYQYCAFADENLYIFGGKIGNINARYLNDMWRYNTINQKFIGIGTLPRQCAYGTTALDGFGHMYLVGCYSSSRFTNEIWVFNTSTERIATEIITTQQAITEAAVVIFNRSLWIFGGWAIGYAISNKVQICDIASFLPTPAAPSSSFPSITSTESSLEPVVPSTEPPATPDALSSATGNNEERDLLLSVIIVLVAVGCFCIGLLYFLWTRNKRIQEEAQLPAIHQQPGAAHQEQYPLSAHVPPAPHFITNMNAVHQPVMQVVNPLIQVSPPQFLPNVVVTIDGLAADEFEVVEDGERSDSSEVIQTDILTLRTEGHL